MAPEPTTEADPRRWEALPVILVATFMGLFDIFVVNVAAPDMQRDISASSADLQLVIGGYAFAYAALLITGAEAVARQLVERGSRFAPHGRTAIVNGGPGVVVVMRGRTFAVAGFTIANDRIAAIDLVIDEAKLGQP